MKQTRLKKKSKSPRRIIIDKADKLLQDWMRLKHKGEKCEICGEPFELSHHYIAKSQSTKLRFDEENLILVCSKCHFKIHKTTQGHYIGGLIVFIRGSKWFNYITTQKNILKTLTTKDLEEKIVKYEKLIEKFNNKK